MSIVNLRLLCNELVTAIKSGKVVFFVGAGISKPFPTLLPLGSELLSSIILSLGRGINILESYYCRPILDAILKGDKATRLEVILHIIENEIGDKGLDFLKIFERNYPNKNHFFLANCLRYGNIIVTTNFDNAIETACDKTGIKYFMCFEDKQFKQLKERPYVKSHIFKLHGTLKDQQGNHRIDTILLTLNQVGKGLAIEKAYLLEHFLKTYDFIFLGYSGLDDFDIHPKLLSTASPRQIFWVDYKNRKRLSAIEYKESAVKRIPKNNHLVTLLTQRKRATCIRGDTSKLINILWERLGFDNRSNDFSYAPTYKWVTMIEGWAQKIEEPIKVIIFGDIFEYQGYHDYAINCYELAEEKTHNFVLKARIHRKVGWALERKGEYNLALNHFSKAFDFVKNLPNTAEKLKTLYSLGWIMQRKGQYNDSVSFFTKALDEPESLQYGKEFIEIYNGLGATFWYMGKWERAIQTYKRNIELSVNIGDIESLARAYNNIGLVHWKKLTYEEAVDSFLKSLELYQKIGNLYGIGSCYGNLGIIYRHLGNCKKALKFQYKSAELHRLKGNLHNEAIAIDSVGNIYFDIGNMRKALDYYKKCRQILLRIGHPHNIAMIEHHIGKVYKEVGKLEESIALLRKSLRLAKRISASEIVCDISYDLAEAILKSSKNIRKALKHSFASLHLANKIGDQVRQGAAERLLAELYLAANNITEAEKHITTSVELLNNHIPLYEIGRSYLTLSKVLQAMGKTSEVQRYLTKSVEIFSNLDMKGDLKKALSIAHLVDQRNG